MKYEELKRHVGHEIECSEGPDEIGGTIVVVQCARCGDVLLQYGRQEVTLRALGFGWECPCGQENVEECQTDEVTCRRCRATFAVGVVLT